jgi:nitrate/nitrite transport system ATP-binding protein
MAFLELANVSFGYGPAASRHDVIAGASLRVEANEFVAVIGFSGSGKSTIISLLAGLIEPDAGRILAGGEPVAGPGPERGVLFQNYSLLPWFTVFGNIELAVKQVFPRLSRVERRARVQKQIDTVNLTGSEWKRPHELSGGMRQRLALARTLAMEPQVLLLDEPLSALDALTRAVLQDEIVRIWEEDRRTVVMITNDIDEAIFMADRIVALKPGPGASFGEEFVVDLPRPRDRKTLNFQDDFKHLRNRVTGYMIRINRESKALRPSGALALPDLEPVDTAGAARRSRRRVAAGCPA